jgi:hypothetical protein
VGEHERTIVVVHVLVKSQPRCRSHEQRFGSKATVRQAARLRGHVRYASNSDRN